MAMTYHLDDERGPYVRCDKADCGFEAPTEAGWWAVQIHDRDDPATSWGRGTFHSWECMAAAIANTNGVYPQGPPPSGTLDAMLRERHGL